MCSLLRHCLDGMPRQHRASTVVQTKDCDDSPSKDLWLQAGWGSQALDTESLYDLLFDPMEHANLILDPGHSEVAKEMRDRLQRWMVSTHDPLLLGPVAAPPGALANDPNGISPKEPPLAARPL
jgi:hypothetical protein